MFTLAAVLEMVKLCYKDLNIFKYGVFNLGIGGVLDRDIRRSKKFRILTSQWSLVGFAKTL